MTRQGRENWLLVTRARADGPTASNPVPTVADGGAAPPRSRREKTRIAKFQTRVEFNNYKASYLRM